MIQTMATGHQQITTTETFGYRNAFNTDHLRPRHMLASDNPQLVAEHGQVPSGSAFANLLNMWVERAVSHAKIETIDDPSWTVVATVAALKGPLGVGNTNQEALDHLRSVLSDWVMLKLSDGDNDIPRMGGISLIVQ